MIISTRTFFKYVGAAILLFGLGCALAWFSEQTFFSKEIFPKKAATATAPEATPDPAAKASNVPSTDKAGRQYTVQSGDTISSIADANGLDFEKLAEYNNIPYPYNLTVGQTIVIPNS